jgi:hypothetical protein
MNITEAINTYKHCPVCNNKTSILLRREDTGICDYTLQNDRSPFMFVRQTDIGHYPKSIIIDGKNKNEIITITCPKHYYYDIKTSLETIIYGDHIISNDWRRDSTTIWYEKSFYRKKILSLPYAIPTQSLSLTNENDFKSKLESLLVLV